MKIAEIEKTKPESPDSLPSRERRNLLRIGLAVTGVYLGGKVLSLTSVTNALTPYGNTWLKREHPEYPKQETQYMPFVGSRTYTNHGTSVRDQEIKRKAFEIVKDVAEREKVDLVLKDDTVLHIANDLVILTDECVTEAEKLS